MKNIYIMLFTFLAMFSYAETLNGDALAIKNNNATAFKYIKEYSTAEWSNNYTMVLYEINNQATALIDVLQLYKTTQEVDIFVASILKWSTDENKQHNIDILRNQKSLLEIKINWSILLFEMQKQIDSKKIIGE